MAASDSCEALLTQVILALKELNQGVRLLADAVGAQNLRMTAVEESLDDLRESLEPGDQEQDERVVSSMDRLTEALNGHKAMVDGRD